MVWFIAVLAVAVLGVASFVATGKLGAMGPTPDDDPVPTLPQGRALAADDLESVSFSYAWRGYKPEQVDALLERLGQQLPPNSQPPVTAPAQNKE